MPTREVGRVDVFKHASTVRTIGSARWFLLPTPPSRASLHPGSVERLEQGRCDTRATNAVPDSRPPLPAEFCHPKDICSGIRAKSQRQINHIWKSLRSNHRDAGRYTVLGCSCCSGRGAIPATICEEDFPLARMRSDTTHKNPHWLIAGCFATMADRTQSPSKRQSVAARAAVQ